jgi:flagellar hook protein FlgE
MALLNSFNSGVNGIKTFSKSLEVIGDNIANVNTTGFKGSRVTNQDSFSETLKTSSAGTAAGGAGGTNAMQVGSGSSVASISQQFTQGALTTTGGPADLGISGKGFFKVKSPSGEFFYTRAGDFRIDDKGNLLTNNGYNVTDTGGAAIKIPPTSGTPPKPIQSFSISKNGEVSIYYSDTTTPTKLATPIGLTSFANSNALMRVGDNLMSNGAQTDGKNDGPAGATSATSANENLNYGDIIQGTLELSNVDLTQQFSDIIVAQRAFQANSRVITVSDSVMEEVVNLKR